MCTNDTIVNFSTVKNEIDSIDNELNVIKSLIVAKIKELGVKEVKTDKATATLTVRESVTYNTDGINLIKTVLPEAIKVSVNNKAVKDDIAKGNLNESLIADYKTEKVSKAVLIKVKNA